MSYTKFPAAGTGTGTVVGPGSSVKYALPYFDDTSGQLLAGATKLTASKVVVSDSNGLPASSTMTQTQLESLLVDAYTGHIVTPADQTITIDEYAAYGYTINTLVTKLSAGTCSIAIKINGTDVTSISAHSATTSQVTSTATAAKTVAAGNRVTMVISSTSSAADLAFTLKITRT